MTRKEKDKILKHARKFGRDLGGLNHQEAEELGLDMYEINSFYNWICDELFNGRNIGYERKGKR